MSQANKLMTDSQNKTAVILMSGGLDSTTTLAIALDQGYECWPLSFDYGQRHKTELLAAERVIKHFNIQHHKILKLDLTQIGGSALTDNKILVPEEIQQGIPITYVPARNTIFLSYALGYAETINSQTIFLGVNAVDYSGYPDCRPEYIEAFQKMANLATKASVEGQAFTIETPLINLTKSEIIKLGYQHGVDYSLTISCYQADENGLACGVCDSCRYRKQGFMDSGITDPTYYKS